MPLALYLKNVMKDHIFMKDDFLYNVDDIHKWLDEGKYTSPMTREIIHPSECRANPVTGKFIAVIDASSFFLLSTKSSRVTEFKGTPFHTIVPAFLLVHVSLWSSSSLIIFYAAT